MSRSARKVSAITSHGSTPAQPGARPYPLVAHGPSTALRTWDCPSPIPKSRRQASLHLRAIADGPVRMVANSEAARISRIKNGKSTPNGRSGQPKNGNPNNIFDTALAQSRTSARSFHYFLNKQRPPVGQPHPGPCYRRSAKGAAPTTNWIRN